MTGLAYPVVTSKIVGDTLLGYPENKIELKNIGDILSNADELIKRHMFKKLHFNILKKGLMQKLLNRKIRVKV